MSNYNYKRLCEEFVDEIERGWSYTFYSINMLDIYSRALKALNRKLKPKPKNQTVTARMNRALCTGDQL